MPAPNKRFGLSRVRIKNNNNMKHFFSNFVCISKWFSCWTRQIQLRTLQQTQNMNLDKIKQEVIYSDSANRLFEISIELAEAISALHLDLVRTDDLIKKTEMKGKIVVLNTLQGIIDKRIDDVRATDKDIERKELLKNRQFRIAAETVLHKDTFERIKELSLMNYKKFKDIKSDLKANKLE
jgi:hypothetical protein